METNKLYPFDILSVEQAKESSIFGAAGDDGFLTTAVITLGTLTTVLLVIFFAAGIKYLVSNCGSKQVSIFQVSMINAFD